MRDIIDVRSKPRKKAGRKPVPPDLVAEIRETSYRGRMPNGERYGVMDLKRLYRVSETSIRAILDRKGAYK